MSVVVLGGGGFIGSAMIDRLRADRPGRDIVAPGRSQLDLSVPETFGMLEDLECETVVHAAGVPGPERFDEQRRAQYLDAVAALGTRLGRLPRLRRVLFFSTGGVFDGCVSPVADDTPPRPSTRYAQVKLDEEAALVDTLGDRVAVVRLFFPFGPAQRRPRLLPRLAFTVASGEVVELDGEDGALVNPLAIGEVTAAALSILDDPPGRYCNLGGPDVVSIRWLAETIGRTLGVSPVFRHRDRPAPNLYCRAGAWPAPAEPLERRIADAVGSWLNQPAR